MQVVPSTLKQTLITDTQGLFCVQYLRSLMNSFGGFCDNFIAIETSNLYVQRNIKHKLQLENDVIFLHIYPLG